MNTHKITSIGLLTAYTLVAGTILILSAGVAVADTVTISNTPTHPVPTNSIDEPARSPVQVDLGGSFCSQQANFGSGTAQYWFCSNPTGYVVPTGKRLVVQQITLNALVSAAPDNVLFLAGNYGAGPNTFTFLGVVGGASQYIAPAAEAVMESNPVLAYYDGGSTFYPRVGFSLPAGPAPSALHLVILGYMIDCTVVTCHPLVTQ